MKNTKRFLKTWAIIGLTLITVMSCKKDEEETPTPTPTFTTVTIGAQDNATYPLFYSVGRKLGYTMDQAFQNQDTIDLLCFYEAASGNNISLASPGSNITGIFEGASAPSNWSVKDTTKFNQTNLTVAQFDALFETDIAIVNSFNTTSNFKKAKNLIIDQVWAFKTQENLYGLLKVTEVVQDSIGYVKFQMKVKK